MRAGVKELLAGSFLDQTPESLTALDVASPAREGIRAQEASTIAPGSFSLKPIVDAVKIHPSDLQAIPKDVPKTSNSQENEPVLKLPTPTGDTVGAGIARGLANTVSGLTTPVNIGLLASMEGAPLALRNAAATGFAAQMAKHAGDTASEIIGDSKNMTASEIAEKATAGIAEAAMAGMGLKHVTGRPAGGGATPSERPMGLQPDGADLAARENQMRALVRGVDERGQLLPEVEFAKTEQVIQPDTLDGLHMARAKLREGFNEQTPEVQAERNELIDSIDEQLMRAHRSDVDASAKRVAEELATREPTASTPSEAPAVPIESAEAPSRATVPSEKGSLKPLNEQSSGKSLFEQDMASVVGSEEMGTRDVLRNIGELSDEQIKDGILEMSKNIKGMEGGAFSKSDRMTAGAYYKEAINRGLNIPESQLLSEYTGLKPTPKLSSASIKSLAEPNTVEIDPVMAKTAMQSAESIADQVAKGQPTSVRDAARDAALDNAMGSLRAGKDMSATFMRKSAQEAAGKASKRTGESLDAPVGEGEANVSEKVAAPETKASNEALYRPMQEAIDAVLNERDARIVKAVGSGEKTVEQIVAEEGISRSRAYQIIEESAPKIQAELKRRGISEEDVNYGRAGGMLQPATANQAPVVPVKAISQIIRDLAKGMDIPIRFGRLTTKGFAGYFKKVENLIGAKRANDINIVSHETGHKFDDMFGMSKLPALRSELDVLGDPSTPGSRSSWTGSKTLKYKHGEGVAEFIRYWMTDPAHASRVAPNTYRYFEQVLDANPDLGATLRTAKQDVSNWRNAPAEARLDSSISVGGNPNKTRYGLSQLTRDLVDDLHILRLAVDDAQKLSGEKLKPSENPYLLARLLRGSYGMADTFIRRGVADYNTRKVSLGTGLEDALKPVAGNIDAFRRYLVAKRAQELHAQGRETGLVPQDVDFVVNKYDTDPAFHKAFNDVKQWNDSLLRYAEDSGYVSKSGAAAMRSMNEDYVPFSRVFEIGAGENPSVGGSGSGRGLNVGQVGSLRKLKGSTRDIVDPLETMIKNAYSIITASEKSAINQAIGELASKPGMGKWVEEIATPKEAVRVAVEKIRDQLDNAGADTSKLPDDLLLQFYRESGKAPYGENIIKVTKDGKTKFYRLKSDLFDAFHALDLEDSSTLIKILSSPAQVLRAGVTLDPAFGVANMLRDAVGSAVINKYGMLPFEASLKGVGALLKDPKLVAEWASSGGSNAIEAAFFDQKKAASYLREKITKDLTPTERATVIIKSPLTALRMIGETFESATRLGEYQRALQENLKAGMSEGDARRQAAFESRDRQDFAKGGAKTKILRHAAAFWNAALQGNVKIYDAFKERPTRTTLQGLAYVTLPTLLAAGLNWNDPDYWDRPQWERDAFWMIPKGKDANGKSTFVRIPKPFLIGAMFGTMPERFLQWAKKNKIEEVGSLVKNMVNEVVPNPVPQVIQAAYADFFSGPKGWDVFRGRQIVPDSIADLPPEMQWTEQTSLTARQLGKLSGMSPMKVDHLIGSTTGGLGKQATHVLIDRVISAINGEERTATNVTPGGRFFSSPSGIASNAVEKFYQEITDLRQKKAGAKAGKTEMESEDRRRLEKMEDLANEMTEARNKARKEKDQTAKQALYLKIRELAERVEN